MWTPLYVSKPTENTRSSRQVESCLKIAQINETQGNVFHLNRYTHAKCVKINNQTQSFIPRLCGKSASQSIRNVKIINIKYNKYDLFFSLGISGRVSDMCYKDGGNKKSLLVLRSN